MRITIVATGDIRARADMERLRELVEEIGEDLTEDLSESGFGDFEAIVTFDND